MTLHDLDAFVRSHRRHAKKKRNGSAKPETNGHAAAQSFARFRPPPERTAWGAHAFDRGPAPTTPEPTIGDLVKAGNSENHITNEIFYRRNPTLRGQSLTGGSAEARTWVAIRDNEVRPAVKRELGNWKVDPVDLAIYLSQYEDDAMVSSSITEKFLTRGPLLSLGKSLRDLVLGNWNQGKAPLSLDQLQALANQLSSDQNTALLLCHNVTKAFARGGTAITWDRSPSAPETYTDGQKTWTPKVNHAKGKLISKHSDKYKRDLPSMFYLLFSDTELGTSDPGDWYHFYVTAAMAAFGAAGALTGAPPAKAKALNKGLNKIKRYAYEELVKANLADIERQMSDSRFVGGAPYRGFVLANAVSFLEGGYYGGDQAEVARESRFHLRGARVGLAAYSAKVGKEWLWYVPKAQGLSDMDLATGWSLKDKTAETLNAST
jgi:hypothetical protein